MKLLYRKEIDGLRAIAVLSVVFYHADIKYFTGGFVGVDIFFVISGYLISSIVINELSHKKFQILNFYNRRARRILPLLLVVLLVSNIAAFVFLTRSELSEFLQSSISTIFFHQIFFSGKMLRIFLQMQNLNPCFTCGAYR